MNRKVIHYCWFGGKNLPNDVKKCIKNWKKICPDYEIKRWDESNFDINCCNFVKSAYDSKAWAFVSDYARLKIIYENGGFYLDTDVILLKKLDSLLEYNCYFGTQQDSGYVATGLGFGAIKGSRIIKEMLETYDNVIFNNDDRFSIACPILNTEVLKKYGYEPNPEQIVTLNDIDVTIFPPKYFDPVAPGFINNLKCKETISIHLYGATWTGKKSIIKRKIINFIGQENINKIKGIVKRDKRKM